MRICIPPRGRGGAGWFQHPQLALRDKSVPTPWSAPPVPPPVRLPSPAGSEWPMRFPTSRPWDTSPVRYPESFDSSGQLPQHDSRFSKLFNPGCIVSMGEYLARGTMGTSPLAYGIGGQGGKAVHGHLGLTTLCDPQGLGSLVGLVLGHAVQGHRACRQAHAWLRGTMPW